ncbi:MAG TPA: AI-2E family transporter [Firmicutes bacterium]|nr:AI-2E family transporter [Bacillota bacterium]
MKEKFKGNNYIYWGVTLFGVVAAAIILVFILLKMEMFFAGITKIIMVLMPIFIGLLFAYLLNPIVVQFEKYTDKFVLWIDHHPKVKIKNRKRLSRALSIFITYFITAAIIVLFIRFVVPSLIDSLNVMIANIPMYVNNIYDKLLSLTKSNPEFVKLVENLNTDITKAFSNIVIPSMDTIVLNITQGISSFLKWVVNIIIGLIVSVYLIYDRESFMGGTRKFLKALLPEKAYDTSIVTLGYINKVFGGFMVAKIIDSILIGILTFLIISIFKVPYALIISLIVGITNIIPYFGPFIGAIPCIVFLLLIDPAKAITFAVLILLIQQFDGNILGPKLIGNKTGIKSFWVLFSILLFGGIFGFVGMIFGVPVFAVIYSVVNNLINKRLVKKTTV